MNKLIPLIFLCTLAAFGAVDVEEIIKSNVPEAQEVTSSKLILNKSDLSKVKALSEIPLETKIYRSYVVKKGAKILGYGILISRKVRSKKATVLYYLSSVGTLKFAEVLAFGEPPEYKPKAQWMSQFKDKESKSPLRIGTDIPTITGATLSARNITDGARLARALFEVKLK